MSESDAKNTTLSSNKTKNILFLNIFQCSFSFCHHISSCEVFNEFSVLYNFFHILSIFHTRFYKCFWVNKLYCEIYILIYGNHIYFISFELRYNSLTWWWRCGVFYREEIYIYYKLLNFSKSIFSNFRK